MKRLYVLLSLFLCVSAGLAQNSKLPPKPPVEPAQPYRLELPLERYTSDVLVQPLPEDSSVVLLVEKDPVLTGKTEYTFQKFDSRLRPGQIVPLSVPRGYEFRQICAEGTDVYALFQGTTEGTLWVAAFDTRTGELGAGEFKTKRAREVHDLKALDGNLFVTVEVDMHLTLLLLDLKEATFRFLPSVYEPLPASFTFLADSVTKRAELILSETNGFKSRLQLKQLSDNGQLLHSEFVQAGSERGLLEAQLSPGDSAARLLAGTYTLRDSRYSQGLFAADLNAGVTPTGQRRSLRYYDFLNLKHFFDFMKPARVARMRQRSERLKATDRQYRHRYRLLMHDMLPTPNGYVLVAEVYYPRYNYSSTYSNFGSLYNYGYPGMGAFSRAYSPLGSRRNDGYRTTHALICGFDRQGNLLWDNSFLMQEVEQFSLRETVRVRPLADGRRLVMAYLKDDNLYYKLVDQAAPAPNDWQVKVQTNTSGVSEKTVNTQQEHLTAWYGSRFLASGYQHVNPEKGQSREVFFVNVIEFR
ncbi:hypothetical protein HNQ93_000290 [Hymenobacter luteus]|uniref:Uncharacterized protein n=2 Tax=Hymenobacter TaxID=89966 RepID=A0A7W9SX27_9BACT|nr:MULTISPECIES: hypothetical protein [Hymenobacter]MBB4600230.1 hypothetical protein [Hymenobacter latericoloratus]MBB6057460.1 hypothetical protein [Hymenobacter luteus]